MNNLRRKEIRQVAGLIEELHDAVAAARDTLEGIGEEEEESRDSMPESLAGSDRYCESEEASEYMEDALGYLDDIDSAIDEAVGTLWAIPGVQ